MKLRPWPIYFFCALSLVLSACGSDGEETTGTDLFFAEPSPSGGMPVQTATATPRASDVDPHEAVTHTPPASTPTPTCDAEALPSPPDPCFSFDESCPPPDRDRCEALHESARTWRPDFPPSVANASCDYASNYSQVEELANAAAEELHVVTVYEGNGAEHGPGSDERVAGVVEIVVRPRPRPIVLALSSYEPVRWQINLEPGATLSRVIAQGYYEQEVEGLPDGVPLLQTAACDCAYGWEVEHNRGGCSYRVAIADIRAITGLRETSFQGCYAGDRFEVPYWTGDPPSERPTPIVADETLAPRDVDLVGCESVTEETRYCLTATPGGISVLGLDTGQICDVTTTSAPLGGGYTTSFAWRGELLYACTDAGLIRISLLDGSWEAAQVGCEAVADFDGGLLLMSDHSDSYDHRTLRAYPDYQAVLDLAPGRTYGFRPFASRMAVHGDRLYAAWHATDTIEVADLALGEPLGVLGLEDYDNWVWGIAVTGDGELVLTDGRERVVLFDVRTGAQVHEVPLSERIFGLACTNRDPAPAGTPTPAPTPEIPTPSGSPASRPATLPSCEELSRTVGRPGQHPSFPPSVRIEKNCGSGGYESSNYANPAEELSPSAPVELHVIGVHDGESNPGFHSQREGVVDVNVRGRPKPVVLVLSADGSTTWRIHLESGAILAKVITQGYETQTVQGVPDAVSVEHRDAESTCDFAYGWEVSQGEGYPLFIADIRAYTGLVETSFQGCYAGVEFDVPYWEETPPITERPTPVPLNEDMAGTDVAFPDCETVTRERQYCLTTTESGVALVGLGTGAVCPLFNPSIDGFASDITSIAWRGQAMYACANDLGLVRISLVDGSMELAQISCEAVADYRGSLLVFSEGYDNVSDRWDALYEYPTYAALLAGKYAAVYDDMGGGISSMTSYGDTLYGAWHSTDTVERVLLGTDHNLSPVLLEDYDGWILGMAVTDDGHLVVSGDSWGDTIRIFDAETGSKLRELHLAEEVSGLACVTRATAQSFVTIRNWFTTGGTVSKG